MLTKRTVAATCVLTACSTIAGATAEQEIRTAEKSWAAAVVKRDFPALEKIYTEQLIYAHATGALESKQQYLNRLRTGAQKYDSITHESVRVAPYGDAVISHSIVRMIGNTNGTPFNDHVMMLHVWVKDGGAWRLAAHQTTKIP